MRAPSLPPPPPGMGRGSQKPQGPGATPQASNRVPAHFICRGLSVWFIYPSGRTAAPSEPQLPWKGPADHRLSCIPLPHSQRPATTSSNSSAPSLQPSTSSSVCTVPQGYPTYASRFPFPRLSSSSLSPFPRRPLLWQSWGAARRPRSVTPAAVGRPGTYAGVPMQASTDLGIRHRLSIQMHNHTKPHQITNIAIVGISRGQVYKASLTNKAHQPAQAFTCAAPTSSISATGPHPHAQRPAIDQSIHMYATHTITHKQALPSNAYMSQPTKHPRP